MNNYDNNSDFNISRLCGISILSQNVNTLNTSTHNASNAKSNHFMQKINAILSTKCDIIFLQDIRASCRIAVVTKLIACTKNGNYSMLYNSSKSKRGVCILYKTSLDLEVKNTYKSQCENMILVDCRLNSVPITLGSVYGPTDQDDPEFIKNIKKEIIRLGNGTFIIAGDLNCIQSMVPLIRDVNGGTLNKKKYFDINPEILNMSNIPNKRNSQALCDILTEEFWVDPFRHFFPNRREFSYKPFNKRNDNRSRIDFFLCSRDILGITDEIKYEPILSSVFDHKAASLKLGISNKQKKIIIDNKYSSFPGMIETATIAALQVYADNSALDLQPIILELNQVLINLQSVVLYRSKLIQTDLLVEQFCISLAEKFENIRLLTHSWDVLATIALTTTDELFFETLQNVIKNEMFSFQCKIRKSERSFVSRINNELNLLKSNPSSTCDEVFALEDKLHAYYDQVNIIECQKNKNWELFNLEKPTTAFCSMNSGKKKADTLDLIQNCTLPGDPVPFISNSDRNIHIKDYFSNIYTSNGPSNVTIENFLGNEIINNPYVQNKILTEEERNSMELPISVDELSESLKLSNKGSAAGHDGWSYKVISVLWEILKFPLCKSFNTMILNGKLGDPFRLVNVKLLPKKGDLNNIKNYRPISLLSNFYKLCSGAFNRRMTRFSDKITSNRQKAYSKSKVAQESIINILDNMKKAILNNSRLAIVLLDFSKAFDNIEFDFMIKTLRFFGFGNYMIQILRTILTGRTGGILTKEGLTELFEFLSGSGQGDSASATLFILGIEILLIKLFLDQRLQKVAIPNPSLPLGTEKLECNAYADDITEMIEANAENLNYLKTIFNNFFALSGLQLNVDKTTIIPCAAADTAEFRLDIINAGFACEDSFTVLGFFIDNKLQQLHKNIDKIKFKMSNIANFWGKVPMSLCGKITVAKTFLLSQISYICSVIPTQDHDFRIFDKIISNFITQRGGIKEKLVFKKVCNGGLGLIRSKDFIDGIRLGLIKRYLSSTDTWAQSLKISQFKINDPLKFDLRHPIYELNPFAKNVAKSIAPFSDAFYNLDGNLLKARLIDNTTVFRDAEGRSLKLHSLDQNTIDTYKNKLYSLRPFDILNIRNLTTLSKIEIERKNDLILSNNDYSLIRNFMNFILEKKIAAFNKPCTSILSFFNKYKKGSRHFREIILSNKTPLNDDILAGLKNRLNIIHNYTLHANRKRDLLFSSTFSISLIENALRANFFNFINSYWKLNSQINKFAPEVQPECSFCIKKNVPFPEKETLSHFFNNCPSIDTILTLLWNIIPCADSLILNDIKACVLVGFNTPSVPYNVVGNVVVLFALSYIKAQRLKANVDFKASFNRFISIRLCMLYTNSGSFRNTLRKSKKYKAVQANDNSFIQQNAF